MARRGRGEGTIRRRPSDGRWEAVATFGEQRRSFYGKTRAEAREKLAAAQRDYAQGLLIGDGRQTVAQYLASWLEVKRTEVKASTWGGYEVICRKHLVPVIGRVKLTALTAQHVQQVIAHVQNAGLSSTLASGVYGLLHQALSAAVRLGLTSRDVCAQVSRPRIAPRELRVMTRDEAQRFLAVSSEQTRLGPIYQLALSTGMRRGELLALRWREVDLEAGRLSVVASMIWKQGAPRYTEPKTRRSRRQIALAPQMVAALREHRHRQRLWQVAAGPAWQGERYGDPVFSDELGFPLRQRRLQADFKRWLVAAGIAEMRFHDLRHTCATLLLAQQVNPKIVSEMLGHATVSMTLDRYSHVLPDMQDAATRAMSAALGW